MGISYQNSQQTTLNVMETSPGGEQVHAVAVTCYMRPGTTLNVSMEVLDAQTVNANRESVAAAIGEYLRAEFAKAAASGIPAPTE